MPKMTGMIAWWSGSVASIPLGWALCDGTNGTPNLLNRIMQGAGGSFSVNDTGGNISHDHVMISDDHKHRIFAGTDLDDFGGYAILTLNEQLTGQGLTENHLPEYHALLPVMVL